MSAQSRECFLKPTGFVQITPTVATGLTPPAETNYALISCQTQPVRFRDDAVDPTAAAGHLLPVGVFMTYTGDLKAIKFIDTAAGASTVNISYYKQV